MREEIDFVVAWVDGNDPAWQEERSRYTQNVERQKWNDSPVRYRDWGLLKYWFRGVEKFAPWVRYIYFVTWGHVPSWLNERNPKLKIIRHDEFIPREYLPTFSSHTIELNLHRIPGLSEQFVYFNDDMYLTKSVSPEVFFKNGIPCDTAVMLPITLLLLRKMPRLWQFTDSCPLKSNSFGFGEIPFVMRGSIILRICSLYR